MHFFRKSTENAFAKIFLDHLFVVLGRATSAVVLRILLHSVEGVGLRRNKSVGHIQCLLQYVIRLNVLLLVNRN
jgi:hypothetical protein